MAYLAGIVLWSIGHYAVHRFWHWCIKHKKGYLSHGERLHHKDPPSTFGATLIIGVIASAIVSGMYALLLFGACVPVSPALPLFLGGLTGQAIDDLGHWRIHHGRWWPTTRHHEHHHHKNWSRNYALTTGVVWDYVFRTKA